VAPRELNLGIRQIPYDRTSKASVSTACSQLGQTQRKNENNLSIHLLSVFNLQYTCPDPCYLYLLLSRSRLPSLRCFACPLRTRAAITCFVTMSTWAPAPDATVPPSHPILGPTMMPRPFTHSTLLTLTWAPALLVSNTARSIAAMILIASDS